MSENSSQFGDKKHWAKWFIDHGFAIFPLAKDSKRPAISSWNEFSHRALTEEEKAKFLQMIEQGHNYAVPGGQKGLVILDIEDYNLAKMWFGSQTLEVVCTSNPCVKTPHGGLHIYLLTEPNEVPPHKFNPAFLVRDSKGERPIADLQSFNSYAVGPGSCINHKECNTDKCPYKGQDITTCYEPIGPMEFLKVDLKVFLKRLVELGESMSNHVKVVPSKSLKEWLSGEKEHISAHELEEFAEKLRKENKFRSVDKAKDFICEKLNEDSVEYKVICEGKTYSEVGIDRSRGDFRVIKTLLYYGLRDPDLILEVLPEDSKAKKNEKWDPRLYFLLTLKEAWKVVSKYLKAKEVMHEDKAKAKQIMIEAIADEITRRVKLVTFVGKDQVKEWVIGLYRFNKKKGIYEPFEVSVEKMINERLEELKDFPLGSDKSRIIKNIKEEIMRRTYRPLLSEPLRIAFKNGTLEWTDKGIIWYDVKERGPKVYAFHYIPWNLKYEEILSLPHEEITVEKIEEVAKRLCPKSLEVFKQWVGDKWVLLFEVIGYTLYPRYVLNKAILLVGEGNNGKSTFLNLLRKILGNQNVSAMPLKRIMEGDKFASIELYHKLANLSGELFKFTVTNTDLFKKLTGEDYVEGQKKFKDPIYFVNYAKLINSTNELPVVKDQSYGFWRRWIVIEFPHQFEQDPFFFDRTFTDQEIEGIVTVSVIAFARVLQRRQFDFEGTSTDVKEKWERASDSVYAFIKDLIESGKADYDPQNGDLFTPVKELYNAYVEWCQENDKRPEPQAEFTKRLESKFRITKDRKKIGGERVMCYVGIRLKEEEEEAPANGSSNSNSIIEIYEEYRGRVVSLKDLEKDLGLRAFELINWCEKKGTCHWIDEEHVEFT